MAKAKPVSMTTAAVVEQPMVAAAPKKGEKLTRGGTSSGRLGQIVSAANRWRENYNPLRGLTMRRAVELLELGQRGDTAYLQWTFRLIERRYPTLSALISRCEAPLLNFDWQIKVKEEMPVIPGKTPDQVKAMAEAQQGTLREAYDRLDNLKAAIQHLHLAEFRGYAHLQKHRDDDSGEVTHLEPLSQWCVCRDGLEGNWWWNPDSKSTSAPLQFLGKDFAIGGDTLPREDFVIRQVERPIDEIGLVTFVRANLCEKDADGFIEIYGIPGGVVIMPGNVPQGKESEYEAAAKLIAEGGSGALPNGSEYKPNDGPRGVDPFTPRLRHLDEQLVMAGTGGMLTMLAESGSGTLAGGAHSDTFEEIAVSRAEKISECFQKDFDAEVLSLAHPGEPALAFFRIVPAEAGAEESLDFARTLVQGLLRNPTMAPLVMNQINLKETVRASGAVVNEEYEEPYLPEAGAGEQQGAGSGEQGAGEELPTSNGDEPPNSGIPNIKNRADGPAKTEVAAAVGEDLSHVLERLQAISEIEDDTIFERRLSQFLNDFPKLQSDILKDSATERALLPVIMQAFVEGLQAETKSSRTKSSSKPK